MNTKLIELSFVIQHCLEFYWKMNVNFDVFSGAHVCTWTPRGQNIATEWPFQVLVKPEMKAIYPTTAKALEGV